MAIHFPNIKATFIHVPKTGGMSFYDWVGRNITEFDRPESNIHATACISACKTRWDDLGTTFSFVRNPYSRLVSMYLYNWNSALKAQEHRKNNPTLISLTPKEIIDDLKLIVLCSKGFDYWLDCICNDRDEIYGLYDANTATVDVSSWFSNTKLDIVIKTEYLSTEFYKIQDLLMPAQPRDPLPWINTTDHKPYRDYYDSTKQAMVARKFKDDLELFEYQF